MAKNVQHVKHLKSNVLDETAGVKSPKLPEPSVLELGEIAINYAKDYETISIKNSSGSISTFSSDEYYTEKKLGSAFTGVNSGKTVTDEFNAQSETIAAALNDLNNSIDNVESGLDGKQDMLVTGRGIDISSNVISVSLPISAGTGDYSIIEGSSTTASGRCSHAEGSGTTASGSYSHAEGYYTSTGGDCSHAEGYCTSTGGDSSHAEGDSTTANGYASHAEGENTTSSSEGSHAEGCDTTASAQAAHAEGHNTTANGDYSHAEGTDTTASGESSHAEGDSTNASGKASHAEGSDTQANGYASHAEGVYTVANNPSEHASGQYNVSLSASLNFGDSGNTLFSVGNGTATNARHNAFEIRQNGDIYIVSGGTSTSPMIKLQDNFDTINTSIEDLSGQSETIAAALVELNKAVDNLIPVTYADLVELKTSNELKPGTLYRITDFVTTTTQENTQSAGHQFDVIVTATDVNVLNENAKAIKHDGDSYFADSTLDAWELKYCLDNDTDRFMWADDTNGKGVIYYMKDEFNNECPYDFKNIQFKRWAATVSESYPSLSDLNGTYCLSRLYNGNDGFNGDVFSIEDKDDFVWRYTFHCYLINENKHVDATLVTSNNGDSICIGNVIKDAHGHYNEDYYYKKIYLNDIVFYNEYKGDGGNVCIGNYIHYGCFNNTFLNGCYYNKLGGYCYFNTFWNDCSYNSFGNNNCSNSFGNHFQNNSFGNNNYSNSFGNYFQNNSFGNNCSYNSFGNSCYNNSFGNGCNNNSFGNGCNNNSFGNSCGGNSFGNGCNNNSFGNECQYIHFLKDYTWYIIVENGNKYIDITSTQSTSLSSKLRNFTITQGVNTDGTSATKKTISHDTVNDIFKTTYQPANSQVISV